MVNDPVLLNDWHPVVPSESLAEGHVLRVHLLTEDIVLWRLQGRVLAWQDRCAHRGTRLSLGKVEGHTLVCAYHGWAYNAEGRCVRIPAHPHQSPPQKAQVKTYWAKEHYDLVWVSLGEPANDIPPFPEWHDPTYRKFLCGPYRFLASGPRAVENFLDVAHFPFVHEGFLGDQSHPEVDDYQVEVGVDGVIACNVRVWQPDPYGTGQGDTVQYTYRAVRPLTAHLAKESEENRFAIFLTITPHAELESTGWMWMAMNFAYDTPIEELRDFQDRIVAQDIPIVESQRPERLPLDVQSELHVRCDRTAIAYRKWLKELGLTFGTV